MKEHHLKIVELLENFPFGFRQSGFRQTVLWAINVLRLSPFFRNCVFLLIIGSFLIGSLGSLLGCANIFKAVSDPNTDAALFYEAKRSIDLGDFNGAIQKIQAMSAEGRAGREVLQTLAGAQAGACGMVFMKFMNKLSQGTGGATLFNFLMKGFTDTAVVPAQCSAAEATIKSIGATVDLRSADENMFLFVLSLVKIGSYIRYRADRDGANSNGDGTLDADFDPCIVSAPADPAPIVGFTDDQMTEIITGFGLLLENAAAVSAVLSGNNSALSSITTIGDACKTANGGVGCLFTNASDVTAAHRFLFRNILASQSQGLGKRNLEPPLACFGILAPP